MNQLSFEEIWERIRKTTELKKYQELAEFVGVTKSNISNRKASKIFPIDWAYRIAKKYELNIEWILEGTGPQRPGKGGNHPEIIEQIQNWIQEQERREPGALAWFTYDFRKKYPEFSRWEKREEGDSAKSDTAAKSNIA